MRNKTTRHGNHVSVVVLARKLCEFGRNDVGRANPVNLVCRDSHADARPAHEDATICDAFDDIGSHKCCEIRVIDPVVAIGTTIDNLMSELREIRAQQFLFLETGVIACNAYLPGCNLLGKNSRAP